MKIIYELNVRHFLPDKKKQEKGQTNIYTQHTYKIYIMSMEMA